MSEYDLESLIENMLKLNINRSSTDDISKLKYINRTNSNTSCNSDTSSGIESGYLSSNDSIYNLIPNRIDTLSTITYGYFGKAKTNNLNDTSSYVKQVKSNQEFSLIDAINHGDDCGFVLSKTNEENLYYLGLADGVSANRLRGYDAKLFPIALLDKCADFLANTKHTDFDQEFISEEFLKNNSFLFQSEEEEGEDEDSIDQDDENEFCDEEQDETQDVFDNFIFTDNNHDFIIDKNLNESFIKYSYTNNDCKYLYKTLLNSHEKVIEQKVYGSSTVCLMALKFINESHEVSNDDDGYSSRTGLLSTCNLGDSGYMIIRNKNVLFKSSTQTHRFNAPYQLGCTPPELLDHDLYRDNPEDSLCQTHEIKSGDFILLSSDGLFDNLYEDEIALIIDNHIQTQLKSSSYDQLNNLNDTTKKIIYNPSFITSDLLSSACEVLIQKADNAGIKRDDMLIILVYVN